jgi:hypothetical protein
MVRDASQCSFAGFCERAERRPSASRALQDAFCDPLPKVVLIAEWSVLAYPLKGCDHIGENARIKITFNHEQTPMIWLIAAEVTSRMAA